MKQIWQQIGLSQEDLITAFVNRKRDIITPYMTIMSRSSMGWHHLAADLGNVYAPTTLYSMVREPAILEALIADNTDLGVPSEPLEYKGPRPRTLGTILAEKRNRISESAEDYEVHTSDWQTRNEAFERIPTRREPLVLPEGYPESDVLLKEPLSHIVEKTTEKGEDWPNESTNSESANEQRRKRRVSEQRQMTMQIRINAILARKREVVSKRRQDKRLSIKTWTHPVWARIAKDLGNVISPKTVYNTAARNDIRKLLYVGHNSESECSEDEEKMDEDEDEDDSSVDEEKPEIKKEEKTDRNDNVTNGFNETMIENAVRKVLKSMDFTSVVTDAIKEVKEGLREEIRVAKEDLRKEIRVAKEDLRKEIRGLKKHGRINVVEKKSVLPCPAIAEAKKDRSGPIDFSVKPTKKHM